MWDNRGSRLVSIHMLRKKILVIAENWKEYASALAALPHFLREVDHIPLNSSETASMRQYDIILLDCSLNFRKGLQILEMIKNASPQSSVIFIAERCSCESIVKTFRLGARDYIMKPVNFKELRNAIEALYHIQQRSREKRLPFYFPYREGLSDIEPLDQILPMRGVLKFIDDNFTNELSLEDLACLAGLSKYHFVRKFKNLTGYTPKEYIISKRIEKAKGLMKEGDKSISGISSEVGFNHTSNFSVLFKKYTGRPPSRFKREEDTKKNGDRRNKKHSRSRVPDSSQ